MVDLITLKTPRSAAAEAFRTLRTNLIYNRSERPLHTLIVTAPAKSHDKSTTAANLAVTLAQAGHKTILVDADLRKPAQADIWGAKSDRGLMTMLTDDAAMSTPPLIDTEVTDLSLLLPGPLPDVPSDSLSNPRMNEIIGVLKARADYVIFDSPPVLAASDAVLLGKKTDGVLLVIRAGSTRRDHAADARQALERVDVNLIGSVLTNAPRERAGNY
jgi:non-specific protein-tyrosine kinase